MPLRPALLLGLGTLVLAGDAAGPRDILGKWYGTSTCVKASWNAACNDEKVRYTFTPEGPDSTHVHLAADKWVGSGWELMGELGFVWDPGTGEWNGDFENTRVKIRWTYRLSHDTLTGEVVVFPDRRVGRHVLAVRTSPPGRP